MKRTALHLSILAMLLVMVAACGAPAAAPAAEAPAAEAPAPAAAAPAEAQPSSGQYHEAPILAELVSAGTLPPVDQRLPSEPLVVTPRGEVGKYGDARIMSGLAF